MLIVRENTECLYVKQERTQTLPDGTLEAIANRVITEKASKRIGRMAFRLALERALKSGKKAKVRLLLVLR